MLLSAQRPEQTNNYANIVPIQIFLLDCYELVNLDISNYIGIKWSSNKLPEE